MNLGKLVVMKSALPEGHRKDGPAKIRMRFIEWSEGPSFTVEVKRRGSFLRATESSIGRTHQASRSVGLRLNGRRPLFAWPRS